MCNKKFIIIYFFEIPDIIYKRLEVNMRINTISTVYSQTFIGNSSTNKHKKPNPKAINIGVAAVGTAIAATTIGIKALKGKKPTSKPLQIKIPEQLKNPIEEVKQFLEAMTINLPKKLTEKQLANAEITKIKTSPFSRIISQTPNPKDFERMTYTDYHDGTGRVYRRLYHNDKIYEASVYETKIADTGNETLSQFNYYFAYENGRIAGVAKQCVYQNGEPYGTYLGKEYIPYPLMVKMKGEKSFTPSTAYTLKELTKIDSRFDVQNI